MAKRLLGNVVVDIRPKLIERMKAEGRFTDEQRRRFERWKDVIDRGSKRPERSELATVLADKLSEDGDTAERGPIQFLSSAAEAVLRQSRDFHSSLLNLLRQGSSANLMEVAMNCSNGEGHDPFDVMRAAASIVKLRISSFGSAVFMVEGEPFEYTREDVEGLRRLDRDALNLAGFLDTVIKRENI